MAGSVALLATLIATTAVTAQQSEDELVARIDELVPLVNQARVEAQAVEAVIEERNRRIAESQGALDTLLVHDMTIITPTENVGSARALFDAAWTEHFGLIESAALPQWVFTFQAGRETREIFVDAGVRSRHIELAWWQSDEDAIAVITSAIAYAVARDIYQTSVGRWVPDDPLREADPSDVFRTMAVTPSRTVRQCLTGSTDSCLVSLGLGPGDPSIETWYTPQERRNLIVSGDFRPGPREDHTRYAACRDDNQYDICDGLLLAENRSWAPLSGAVRSAFLGFALDRGGQGAWARLVEKRDAPVEEALAYSAGVDLDALVTEWRSWIVDNRPESYAALGPKSVLAALWILCFAAMAMRSTRWRLG